MCDNLVYLEPTFTFNGIPILPAGCQASVCSGRQKAGCGYPPSFGQESKLQETAFWGCLITEDKVMWRRKLVYKRVIKYKSFLLLQKINCLCTEDFESTKDVRNKRVHVYLQKIFRIRKIKEAAFQQLLFNKTIEM